MEKKRKNHKKATGKKQLKKVSLIGAFWKFTFVKIATIALLVVFSLSLIGWFLLQSVISSPHLNNPTLAHYHLRLQLIIEGNQIDFSKSEFQESYDKNNCSAQITDEPIHFHDNNKQLLHVHWQGITGGEVLKYFGLNKIGGIDGVLGYRLDSLPKIEPISTKSSALPKPNSDSKMFIYKSKPDGFQQVSETNFLFDDLENTLKKSISRQQREANTTTSNPFFIRAYSQPQNSIIPVELEGKLNEINDLIGNIVIFIQKTEPAESQVSEKFNNLVPLTASVCGG
jgi:hypothetical protein